jgi:glycosyltransferase involved in cell wall biosynthesis
LPAKLIVLDGTPLAGPPGGIQRFTQELLSALESASRNTSPETTRFAAWSDQLPPRPTGLAKRWWSYGLPRRLQKERVALFHGTDFAVPYWPVCPSVMTIHDLSPWREPTPANTRVRQRTTWLLRAKIPTLLHTPSEAIREEVIERFRWPARRIAAIPHAAADWLLPTQPFAWPKPYFLYVGTLEDRKNLAVAIAAAQVLWKAHADFDLLLAGHSRPNYSLPEHPRLHKLGYVPDAQLPALYSGTLATLYPSTYEGFGLPILEAMKCGSPVLTSDLPVLRETGGSAAVYLPPADAGAWASAMRNFLHAATPDQADLRLASLMQASKFSWARTAQAMMELYERALG